MVTRRPKDKKQKRRVKVQPREVRYPALEFPRVEGPMVAGENCGSWMADGSPMV